MNQQPCESFRYIANGEVFQIDRYVPVKHNLIGGVYLRSRAGLRPCKSIADAKKVAHVIAHRLNASDQQA